VKFILVISLCSFVNNQCLPPVEVDKKYNSWNDCAIAAIDISKDILIAQGKENVNKNKLATRFNCNEVSII
jgi:hypothetical protein